VNEVTQVSRVALVGRPNVGKSTLFNRLVGKRQAITDPTPGVTRDAVESVWKNGDRYVLLADTGGYQTEGGELDRVVAARSIERARSCDLIVLVLDIRNLTPEDEDFIALLRPYASKILVALNKADSPEKDTLVADFLPLGFAEYVCISASHGRGVDELTERVFDRLPRQALPPEPEPDLRLAILGKPNAGKSTLVNLLTESELSIVSEIPGTTRDPVEGRFVFQGRRIRVIDTAGIRRRGKVVEDVEYYSVNRAIKTISECDVVLLLIDAEEGLTDQDKKIAYQIVKEGRGIIFGLNKWDLLPKIKNQVEAVRDRIRFLFPILDFAPVVPLSAKQGEGLKELLQTVVKVYRQLYQRIDTAKLNEMLRFWMEDLPTPQIKGVTYKIRYLTQVSVLPVKFVAFGNHGKDTPSSMTEYLVNRIRKDLGFSDVPIQFEVRGGK
jgi:GTP-binding protein